MAFTHMDAFPYGEAAPQVPSPVLGHAPQARCWGAGVCPKGSGGAGGSGAQIWWAAAEGAGGI